MSDEFIDNSAEVAEVSDILLDNESIEEYDDDSDINDDVSELSDYVDPPVLGAERRPKANAVDEIADLLEDEGVAPVDESAPTGEQPETQAGIDKQQQEYQRSLAQTPDQLTPIANIKTFQEGDNNYKAAQMQMQQVQEAAGQLDAMLENNQITPQQHREGMLNAQGMYNKLDSYQMQLQRTAAGAKANFDKQLDAEFGKVLEKHPELNDKEVYKQKMTQVRNFLGENFSPQMAKSLEKDITAEGLNFLIKMQELSFKHSQQGKQVRRLAQKVKHERKQQKQELKHARNPAPTSNGQLGMSNKSNAVDKVSRLLMGG